MKSLQPQTDIHFDFDLSKPLESQHPYHGLYHPDGFIETFPYPFHDPEFNEDW